jgi:hypothetical protein
MRSQRWGCAGKQQVQEEAAGLAEGTQSSTWFTETQVEVQQQSVEEEEALYPPWLCNIDSEGRERPD